MKIIVQQLPLFHQLDDTQIQLIDQHATTMHYAKHSYIHFEQDRCDSLEIILEGAIYIEQLDEDGSAKIIREEHAGRVFGLNSIYSTNRQYLMNIVAAQNSTILRIPKHVIDELLTSFQFRINFLRLLSDNSIQLGQSLKQTHRVTLRQQIVHYITTQEQIQQTSRISFHTSKSTLAKHFGVERTSLSRELQKMKNDGLIDYDRYTIQLSSSVFPK